MIKAFFTGDIVNTKGTDFLNKDLVDKIRQCDISVCNLEAPIAKNVDTKEVKVGPTISQNKNIIEQLKGYGFSLFGMANNHIYDYGDNGVKNTISKINKLGLDHIGAGNFDDAYKSFVFKKENLSIGIISAAENGFGCHDYLNNNDYGYAWINHKKIFQEIQELKKNVNYIVLLAHTGAENIPIPLYEWREKYKFYCDLGVDVIISHHPHVPQGYEEYGKSIIFYSLGNFYFDTCGFEKKQDDSYSVNINFSKSGISKEIIFHKKQNGILTQTSPLNVNFSIEDLNSYLKPKNYNELHDDYCLKLYEEFYKFYYQHSMISIEMGFFKFLKKFIKYILGIESLSDRRLLLYHLITIESHKYVVRSALKKLILGN